MSLDSLQKPTSASETLLEYLERKSCEQCDAADVLQTPVEEILHKVREKYNSLNITGLVQNVNLPLATHTIGYLLQSTTAQYSELYRVISSSAAENFDGSFCLTLLKAHQQLLMQITEQLQFGGDRCPLFTNLSPYHIELLSAILYCGVDRCSPVFHYISRHPNSSSLLVIFIEMLRTEILALNILRHIGAKYAAFAMENDSARGYRERYEQRIRQLHFISGPAPRGYSTAIVSLYANCMSAFLFLCCNVSPVTGQPSSRSTYASCNATALIRDTIRPHLVASPSIDEAVLSIHYFATTFNPITLTLSLLQMDLSPITSVLLRIAYGQFIRHVSIGEITLLSDEMTVYLKQCAPNEDDYIANVSLTALRDLDMAMEREDVFYAVTSLMFCSPIVLTLFLSIEANTNSKAALMLYDIEIKILRAQCRLKEEMRVIKRGILLASQSQEHTTAIRYCRDLLCRIESCDLAEYAYVVDLLSSQHCMLGEFDDAIGVLREGVEAISHGADREKKCTDDYQLSLYAESLHLKLCTLLLNYAAPGHAVLELQLLYQSTVHQHSNLSRVYIVDRQVAILSWLAKAYLKLHALSMCRQVLRHIKQLSEQVSEARTLRHTPRHGQNGSGQRERDSIKLGSLFSDTLESALPLYCISKHSINLGELFGRLYLAWHRPLTALKHLLPTIIVVELAAHQCNYEPAALVTLGRLYYLYGKVYRYIAQMHESSLFPFNIGSNRLFEAVKRVFNECSPYVFTAERSHQRRYSKTHHSASSGGSSMSSYQYGIPTLAHTHRCHSAHDAEREAISWFRRSFEMYTAAGSPMRAAKSAIAQASLMLSKCLDSNLLSPSKQSHVENSDHLHNVADILTMAVSTVSRRIFDLLLMLDGYLTMAELRYLQSRPLDALAYFWEARDVFYAFYVSRNAIPLLRRISYGKGQKIYKILQRLARFLLLQPSDVVREHVNVLQLCIFTSYDIKRIERQIQCWAAIGATHLQEVVSSGSTSSTPRTQMYYTTYLRNNPH